MYARHPLARAVVVLTTGIVGLTWAPAVALADQAPAGGLSPTVSGRAQDDHHAGSGLLARTPAGQLAAAAAVTPAAAASGIRGVDVSGHQGAVDWRAAWNAGARFAIVKATEGTGFRNVQFGQQYGGSYRVGMTRGAYHFALPNRSSGAAQAAFFVANGGAWTADGRTLPPALDIEYNPYGKQTCYGMTDAAMVAWIRDFVDEVKRRTGRLAMIYTTRDWWARCTGNSAAFRAHPLWLARYSSGPGTLPAGWAAHTIWQYSWHGSMPGDQNLFNGSAAALRELAMRRDGVGARVAAVVPTRISVGAPTTRLPWTVFSTVPTTSTSVRLTASNGKIVAVAAARSTPASGRVSGAALLPTRGMPAFGSYRWTARANDLGAQAVVATDIRARTMLGAAARRSGSRIDVAGAIKVYDAARNTYPALSGRVVTLQVWTSRGWQSRQTAPADRLGHLSFRLDIPWRVGVRLVTGAGVVFWNAESVPVAV